MTRLEDLTEGNWKYLIGETDTIVMSHVDYGDGDPMHTIYWQCPAFPELGGEMPVDINSDWGKELCATESANLDAKLGAVLKQTGFDGWKTIRDQITEAAATSRGFSDMIAFRATHVPAQQAEEEQTRRA